jgi:hypothetical protein
MYDFIKFYFVDHFRSVFDLVSFLIFVGERKKCLARPSLSSGEFEELTKKRKEMRKPEKKNSRKFSTNNLFRRNNSKLNSKFKIDCYINDQNFVTFV